MTSTITYQGMDSDSKPSSRVLAPPGGGSSNIFGTQQPNQAAPKKAPEQPKETVPAPQPAPQAGDRYVRAAPKQAFNPITGAPYDTSDSKKKEEEEEEKEEKPEAGVGKENEQKAQPAAAAPAAGAASKEKTSTRIAQPPGGKSSGPLW